MTLEFHPLANLFPLIEGPDFAAMVADMRDNGYRSGEEIVLFEGKILDGRNRYRAALEAGLIAADEDPRTNWLFVQFGVDGIDGVFGEAEVAAGPLAYVLAKNLARRHLSESQRAAVADRLALLRRGGAAKKDAPTQADAAAAVGVSERLVRHARVVREKGTAELAAAVDRGQIAVSLAAQAANLPVDQQQAVVREAAAGHANAVRTVVKREARSVKEKALADKQNALPDKRYGVILADPEWRFEPRSRDTGMDRAPENHYPTSPTADIMARQVGAIAAEHCALWLWATSPMLGDALMVMAAWGFTYRTHLVWVKERAGNARGPGYWLTGEHELLLLGTKGQPPAPAPGTQWGSVLTAPVGAHSEKPEEVYELIEAYFPNLPKIELNARRARPGWKAWGLEAPDNDSRGGAESRSTGYLESTDNPGSRSTLTEKEAATPGEASAALRQRRKAAAPQVKGPARDALRGFAPPRESIVVDDGGPLHGQRLIVVDTIATLTPADGAADTPEPETAAPMLWVGNKRVAQQTPSVARADFVAQPQKLKQEEDL